MLMEQALMILGASIIGILGTIHLIFTFFTSKLRAYKDEVNQSMMSSSLVLTKHTTMWKAWVGFNASHSLGAMLLAAVYVPLSLHHFSVIEQSLWFSLLPVVIGLSYLFLAAKYWFNLPFWGIFLATLCFSLGVLQISLV